MINFMERILSVFIASNTDMFILKSRYNMDKQPGTRTQSSSQRIQQQLEEKLRTTLDSF